MKTVSLLLGLVLLTAGLTAGNRIVFYHNNYGMISETINIPLERGVTTFEYEDLPLNLEERSVMLTPLENNFTVQAQRYINPAPRTQTVRTAPPRVDFVGNYLQSHIGKDVEVVMADGSMLKGTMFYQDRAMIGLNDRASKRNFLIRFDEIRNFVLGSSEYDFDSDTVARYLPYLSWMIHSDKKGTQKALLTYLCTGFSWEGLYKAVWDDDTLYLETFARLSNDSGKSLQDFRVLLVAGEPKRATRPRHHNVRGGMVAHSLGATVPDFSAEVFDEYHLFTYSEPLSMIDRETQQIRLYPSKRVKTNVHYEYITGTTDITTHLKFKNEKANNLGIALPSGTIQLYREDENDKMLTFIGEDYVNATPVDEELTISPGKAFDVVAKTTTLDSRNPARNITERDMQVEIRNQSDKRRRIKIIHSIRGRWTITRNSHSYERRDADTVVFRRDLAPKEELKVSWTERVER